MKKEELYEYILENYTNSIAPVTRIDIARKFGLTVEQVESYILTHNLKRQKIQDRINIENQIIEGLLSIGYKKGKIAEILGITNGALTYRLKKLEGCEK